MDHSHRFNALFGRAATPTPMGMQLPSLRLETSLPLAQADAGASRQPSPPEAADARARLAPPLPSEPSAPAPLDTRRVGQNALVSAISQGGCFGTAFALNNYLRAAAPPMIKRLAAILSPLLAGFLTSPAEKLVREKVGMQPTKPSALSLLHDAIPSAVLYAVNAAYANARRLPKFAPTTPAGAATTLLLSATGTGLAGALAEAAAQASGGKPMEPLTAPEATQRGIKRALCLAPMALANWKAARYVINHNQPVPRESALDPLKAGTRGWLLRNHVPLPSSLPSPASALSRSQRHPPAAPTPPPATPVVQQPPAPAAGESLRTSPPAKPPSPPPSGWSGDSIFAP